MKYFIKGGLLICVGHLAFLLSCNEKPLIVPSIRSFSPSTSPIEGVITINGKNFGKTPIENLVHINGANCSILSISSDTLLVVKADLGISSGILSVTVDHLAAIAATPFTLVPHAIDSISSYSGSVGDKIDFSGSYFCANADDVEVTFNTQKADIINYRLQNDTTYFSTLVPVGATTGRIHVQIGAIAVQSKQDFIVN